MDVHLRDLRYFVAVAEELSFTRAAKRLYVSQPVLSKQIRQLERNLRATLLRRDSRGVTLSPAGLALLPHAQRLLKEWSEAADEAVAADAQDHRVLRVGLQTSIGRDLYPAASAALRRAGRGLAAVHAVAQLDRSQRRPAGRHQ
jgi:DNA-binding transcriptional LysR family regulator